MVVLLSMGLFSLCFAGMAVGVLFSDRALRGSCGGESVRGPGGEALSCGACPKKAHAVCPSDDPLVALAQIAHPRVRNTQNR